MSFLSSGPSKIIVKPIYRILNQTCRHRSLHGRFAMPMEGIIREAQELLTIKREKRERLKRELKT